MFVLGALLIGTGVFIGGLLLTAVVTALSPGRAAGQPWTTLAVLLLLALLVTATGRSLRRIARPLRDLVEAARRIEEGDYSVRVRERGPREVAEMAHAFNHLTASLEATETKRRSVLADVAHELRTPLSVVRGQAEAIADGIYPGDAAHVAPIIQAARTIEALAENLRTMVLSDAGGLTLRTERVELPVLLNETIQAYAGGPGARIETDIAPDLPAIEADPLRLRSIFGNLLANAIQHTPAGGTVKVGAVRTGDAIEVTVADTGEGIPAQLLPRVFERFAKGEGSSGSGLGLAIARDLVEAHGGSITISSDAGAGTTARVTLPLDAQTRT
jgi:two-component system sensor histidine kinase BaeS